MMNAPSLLFVGTLPTGEDGKLLGGFVVVGQTAEGYYLDTAPGTSVPEGAVVVESGAGRYARLAGTTHAASVLRARVYRSRDGSSLRKKANDATQGSLGSRVPATGRTSATPSGNAKALEVLEAAEGLRDSGVAALLFVTQGEILSGDVVEEDWMAPHQWFGAE